jgi:hypothetical protein
MKNSVIKFNTQELVQEEGNFVTKEIEHKLNSSEIIKKVINERDPQKGYGDLEEQITRWEIIKKCKSTKLDKSFNFSLEEVEVLKKCFETFTPFILCEDLIQLQKTIKEL